MTPPPRKWLMDRIKGTSKYSDGERPPCPCCWVPPPVGWCPALLEENFLCKCIGCVGCYASESARCFFMHFGFVLNLVACLFTIYACFSISESFDVLSQSSFGEISLTEVNGKFPDGVELFIGLRAAALDNPINGVGEVVVGFDQICDLDGFQRYMDPADCETCREISANTVTSLIMAVVSFLPSFTTDILRMYSGYDVNCQKFFAVVFGTITVLLTMNTLFTYKFYCSDKFYSGIYGFDADGNVLSADVPTDSGEYEIDFDYTWGWGLMFLLAGTVLKFADAFFHCIVPTPIVTRDNGERTIYEKIKGEDEEEEEVLEEEP